MNILIPSHRIVRITNGGLDAIEEAARVCYLSEPKRTTQEEFLVKLQAMGHQTPFEFMDIEIEFICDRGVSHEAVRHRMCSPMQESTRYCDYSENGKHGMNVIRPVFFDENAPTVLIDWSDDIPMLANQFMVWSQAMEHAEWAYNTLLDMGATPQEARSVLPNSLKTKLKIKANVREWWHIFKLRALNTGAHPQIREIMIPALYECADRWPVLFAWLLKDLRQAEDAGHAKPKNPDN